MHNKLLATYCNIIIIVGSQLVNSEWPNNYLNVWVQENTHKYCYLIKMLIYVLCGHLMNIVPHHCMHNILQLVYVINKFIICMKSIEFIVSNKLLAMYISYELIIQLMPKGRQVPSYIAIRVTAPTPTSHAMAAGPVFTSCTDLSE